MASQLPRNLDLFLVKRHVTYYRVLHISSQKILILELSALLSGLTS